MFAQTEWDLVHVMVIRFTWSCFGSLDQMIFYREPQSSMMVLRYNTRGEGEKEASSLRELGTNDDACPPLSKKEGGSDGVFANE